MTEFNRCYEAWIHEQEVFEGFGDEQIAALRAKREAGTAKYGALSFQMSPQNASRVPVLRHLAEELYDAVNYTNHAIFMIEECGGPLSTAQTYAKGELYFQAHRLRRFLEKLSDYQEVFADRIPRTYGDAEGEFREAMGGRE